MHGDVETMVGKGLAAYAREPWLNDGRLDWRDAPKDSGDRDVLRPANDPFDSEGGIRLLTGNLGRSIIKVSAVKPQHRVVRAPAAIFDDQDKVLAAFKDGKLHRDVDRGRARAGAARQRHAGAAQADALARRAAGPRLQGRAGDRRPHVRRVGQGAGRHPCLAGSGRRRADRQAARRRRGRRSIPST